MQDIDTTSTQSLIDRYYEEEKAQRELEQTLASFTMRVDANDLAMLNMIARRFRKTREEVAQEVLSNALIDLFARVEAGERKLMARDADDAARSVANEIAEENGLPGIDFKPGYWANNDRQITKIERKKAKLAEQAEKEEPIAMNDDADDETMEAETQQAPVEMENEVVETSAGNDSDAEEVVSEDNQEAAQPVSVFG